MLSEASCIVAISSSPFSMDAMGSSGDPLPSLDLGEGDGEASREAIVCVISRSDSSMLTLTLSVGSFVGDTGEAGVASRPSTFLKFRVTRLDTGSVGGGPGRGGVLGAAAGPDGGVSGESIFIFESEALAEAAEGAEAAEAAETAIGSSWDLRVSTDLLGEAEDGEVRRRFLADDSFSSSP